MNNRRENQMREISTIEVDSQGDVTVVHDVTQDVPTPLSKPMFAALVVCAAFLIISGAALLTLSIALHGLISFHGSHQKVATPVLYWIGIAPFLLGLSGIHALTRKNRKRIYVWGLCVLLVLLFETAVMGWVGNFTAGYYDVWPPDVLDGQYNTPSSVCQQLADKTNCYCNDKYHGILHTVELPGVSYIYHSLNKTECHWPQHIQFDHCYIRWRETRYQSCDMVSITSTIYYAVMSVWGVTLVTAVVACLLAHIASLCEHKGQDKFSQFENEAEDEIDTSHVTEGTPASRDGRVVLKFMEEIHS